MALQAKRGDFQITTGIAGTTLQVRGIGFQGKVVLFWWNGRDGTADASGEASYRSGFGWAVSATERRALAFSSLHAAADQETDHYRTSAACIATVLPGTGDPSTLEGLADFGGFVSDGFDIVIDDAFATVFRVHFIVLGGSDITNVATGTYTGPGSTGLFSVTGVGFKPDLLFLTAKDGGSASNVEVFAIPSIGFASGSGVNDQAVLSQWTDDAAATTSSDGHCRRGTILHLDSDAWASINAFQDDGFQLNYQLAGAARDVDWLAIKGIKAKVLGVQTSTSNGASVVATGSGFAPVAALFFSACAPEDSEGSTHVQATMSIGAADGSTQAAIAHQDKDAQATADTWTALDYDKVYINPDVAATQAVEGLAALASFDGDGLTLTMTDGDPVASFLAILCFGTSGVGGVEDDAGILYRGAPVIYTNAYGESEPGMLESSQAAYGQVADIAVLRVSGSTVIKASITSVVHKAAATAAPYWLSYSGEVTSPPILQPQGSW